jgi:hypothetical protein
MKTQLARIFIPFCLTLNFYLILGQYSAMAVEATPPSISSFTPASGPVGTTVTITGSNFNTMPENNIVYFGATRAVVSEASATSLTVMVSMGATYRPITVTDKVSGLTAYSTKSFIPTFAGGSAFDANSFAASNTFSTGSYPKGIVTGDLDGDGRPDIVSVNGSYSISIIRNTSTGGAVSFEPKMDYATSSYPGGISIGDLDGDGNLDIVVSNSHSNTISVFRNTSSVGSISFAAKIDFDVSLYPEGLSVGDLDGDGKPDLAITNNNSSTVSILKNTSINRSISFSAKVDFLTGTHPVNVSIGDLDGDSKPDLIVANNLNNTISTLRNTSTNGTISFAGQAEYSTGDYLMATGLVNLSIGDLDGDDKSDIVTLDNNNNKVSVFRNTSTTGAISFAARIDYNNLTNYCSIVVNDLDGDKKPDLAITSCYNNVVSILRNRSAIGMISFDSKVDYPMGLGGTSFFNISICDLDADKRPDLAIAGYSDNISILRNTIVPSDSLPTITSFSPSSGSYGTTVFIKGNKFTGTTSVKFGGVAALSFIVVSDTTINAILGVGKSGCVSVTTPNGTATLAGFTFALPIITSFYPDFGKEGTMVNIYGRNFEGATAVTFGNVPVASFNVISDTSIIAKVASGSSGKVNVTTPNGIATLGQFKFVASDTSLSSSPVITSFYPVSGKVGTIIAISGTNFNAIPANNVVYFGATRAVVSAASATSLTVTVPKGATYKPVSVTDIATGLTGHSVQPFVPTFAGGPAFDANSFAAKMDFTSGSYSNNVSISDLDGDGKPDLAYANFVCPDHYPWHWYRAVSVLKNISTNGKVSFINKMDFGIVSGEDINVDISISDLDGDGKPDIIATYKNYGGSTISVLRNISTNGTVSFADRVDITTGLSLVSISDLDGDGKPDLVVTNDNILSVFRNTSTISAISFANKIDIETYTGNVFISDLDGDGRSDVVVANSDTISLNRNTSTSGIISFAAKVDFVTESSVRIVSINDLDGDNKPELIALDANNNIVSVFRNTSTGSSITFAAKVDFTTGVGPNSVSIGDLDGDGKPDIAVANSGSISLLRNTSTIGEISFVTKFDYNTGGNSISIGDLDGDGKPDIAITNGEIISVLRNTIIPADSIPSIVSFSPVSGTAGAMITIKGNHFTNTPSVMFGGVEAASYTVVSDTLIIAIVKSGGTGSVSVMNHGRTATLAGFIYTIPPPPVITAFAPGKGPIGTTVVISGSNFNVIPTNNAVFFGATRAIVSAASTTSLTVTVPNGATCQPVTVTNILSGLTAFASRPFITTFDGGPAFDENSFDTGVNFGGKTDYGGLAIGDLDGDGNSDVVTANNYSNSISVYRNISTNGGLSFADPVDFGTNGPFCVRIGDLDGDGKLDLIVTGSTSTIFKNTSTPGSISFVAKTELPGGAYHFNVSIQDFNGDGKPDIVAPNTVYRNTSANGVISFAPQIIGIGASFAVGDFNEDGKPDIAAVNYDPNDSTIVVFRNTTTSDTISFADKVGFIAGSYLMGISVGDFDGDGKPDIAAVCPNADNEKVFILRNISTNGEIAFADRTDHKAGNGHYIISISDLNGDGMPDITLGGEGSYISILKNTSTVGRISFADNVDYLMGFSYDFGIGDLNGDGKPDLAVVDGSVSVFKNAIMPQDSLATITSFFPTSGTIGSTVTIKGRNFTGASAVSFGGTAAASYTVVSDTIITAVVGSGSTGSVSVTTPRGTASLDKFLLLTPPPVITVFTPTSGTSGTQVTIVGTHFSGATMVSFGDTLASSYKVVSDTSIIAIIASGGSGNVNVITPWGSATLGGFTFTPPLPLPVILNFTPASGATGSVVTITGKDFNTVPSNDVVFFGATQATVLAASAFSLTVTVPTGATYQPISVTDITTGLTGYSKQPFITTFSGETTFNAESFIMDKNYNAGYNPLGVSINDLNGDGKIDIAFVNDGSSISILKNTSRNGITSFADKINLPSILHTYTISSGDLDGDGKPDLITGGGKGISIYRNTSVNGLISFVEEIDYTGLYTAKIFICDLDADGKPDLVIANDNEGNTISILKNTSTIGTISFAEKVDFTAGTATNSISAGDLDGDGKPDLVVGNRRSNTFSVLRNISTRGNILLADKIDFSTVPIPESVYIADLDGDNKPDVVITSQINNAVLVFKNTSNIGNISLAEMVNFTAGPLPRVSISDLNGDGKLDLAVANSLSNSVSILRNTSINHSISFAEKVDYITGSLPQQIVIGDINGDNMPDLVVPNFSSNTISVLKNMNKSPSINSFTPMSGTVGTMVTIAGTHFTGSTAVSFGGTPAASFMVVSDTLITAIVASGSSGSISITTPDGTATLDGFTFIPSPPVITSISPPSGVVGTSVTITGSNFNTNPANNIVFFGATRAIVSTANSTSLKVTAPIGATYQPISVTDITTGLTAYSNLPFITTFTSGYAFDANSFAPKIDFTSGTDPGFVSISDLDGDGRSDIAIVNRFNMTVSVLRNLSTNKTVSFDAKVDFWVGPYIAGISVGDLDGDGKPDIVTSTYYSDRVSVLHNTSSNGTISFDEVINFNAGSSTFGASIADLNGDGKPEIVVPSVGSNSVSVLRNTSTAGTISFASRIDFASQEMPWNTFVSDLDQDGKPDISVTNYFSSSISVLRNTSSFDSISFAARVDIPADDHPLSLSIGDLDGDGKPDMVVANDGPNTISVYRNTSIPGIVSFAPKVDVDSGSEPFCILLGDLDGDGKPDLTVNYSPNIISVLRNTSTNGLISFTNKFNYTTEACAYGTSIGDLDGDGKPDMVVADCSANTVSVFRNTITPTPPSIASFSPTSGPVGTTVTIAGTNFNTTASNNIVFFGAIQATVSAASATSLTVTVPTGATYKPISVTDLATGLTGYSAQPFVSTFTGGNAFNANSFAAKADFTAGTNPTSVSISDLDGDGKPDLAAVNSKSNTVSVFRNIGTRDSVSFAGKMDYTTGIIPTNISVGDLDGDGKPDLVVTSTGKVSVFRNTSTNGAMSFASRVDYTTGSLPVSVAIGDMDGDGRPDLAVANSKSNTVSVFKSTSTNGIISFAAKVDYTTGQGPVSISIVDLDGDGKPELAVASVVGIVSVFKNTSTNTISFIPNLYLTAETGLCGVSIGDLDGDGKLDLAVINAVANTVSVYLNTSTSTAISFAAKVDYVTGTDPASVSIGDLNGDGKPDLAVTNDGSNTVSVYRNTSTSGTVSFVDKVDYTTGARPAIVSIGDLNGDGKPDLAVANYYSNTVSVIRNTIRLNQTITFGPIPVKTYGMADFTPGATSSSSLPVLYTSSNSAVAAILSDQVHIVGSGSCFIYADQAGDASYNAAPQVSQSLTVDAKALTIKADSGQSKKAGAADPMLTYTITEGSLVAGDSLTGTLTYVSGEIVGTYAIQIGTLTAGSNYIITFIPNTFRIVSGTGINNIVTDKPSIYPNPTSGLVSIDISEGTVIISDISGKVLLETTLKDHKTIDLGSFPSGIYVLMLKTKDSIYEFKILKN